MKEEINKNHLKNLTWTTRIFSIIIIAVIIFANRLDAWSEEWPTTTIWILSIILLFHTFTPFLERHEKIARALIALFAVALLLGIIFLFLMP
jgi:hypothetical protein